jgi:general secretion pathway protein D
MARLHGHPLRHFTVPVSAAFRRRLAIGACLLGGCAAWLPLACGDRAARAADPPPQQAPEPAEPAAEAARAAAATMETAISRAAREGRVGQPAAAPPAAAGPVPQAAAPAAQAALPDDLLVARVSAEVAAKQLEARRVAQKSPGDALALLDEAARIAADEQLPERARTQLAQRIERARRDVEESTGRRRGELDMERKSAQVEARVDRERAQRVEVDQRLALLVEEYNALIDSQRFAEAEAVAKKAGQIAPENPIVRQLLSQSRVIRRLDTQKSIESQKRQGFLEAVEDVERSSAPFVGPIEFPTTRTWEDLTKNRTRMRAEGNARSSPAEVQIQKRLAAKVRAAHRDQPLSAVLDALAKQADVPIHLDMVGLEQEAVRSDTPVTISLDQPISLKSALKLLLEPLHLDYVIKDEVLKVTSPRLVKGQVYSVSYPVADLVIPIPNFSSDNLGIAGALREGYSRIAPRNAPTVQFGPAPAGINAAANTGLDLAVDPASLAQFQPGGSRPPASGGAPAIPFGPPSAGGAQADFQSLIDLIQNTISPQTWDTTGGPGAIRQFDTNLSIVVSQTQEVHEQIADLLEQLRRLQDLQVTIEVRFIRLNDTFFERIGVDFDFNIQTGVNQPLNVTAIPTQGNSSQNPATLGLSPRVGGPSQLIGLDNSGNPGVALGSGNLGGTTGGAGGAAGGVGGVGGAAGGVGGVGGAAGGAGGAANRAISIPSFFSIPFRQNSFGSATVPALPGLPDPTTSAANFGFAILSDIEAFFLIQAAQGNTRSNVMQAPKVTLFNGQNAFISDSTQRPFVTSVVPVVGDFAAAQQPVITVLSEGTAVNVQAVVSSDRRFVRLTLVPFFSQIGKVEQFQFEGTRSTKSKSSDETTGLSGDAAAGTAVQAGLQTQAKNASEQEVFSRGTTIQLPEFIFTTVTTTVSVPDGGTVLLGGIKRLREGRNEFGVPILSKIPYINRLFKNVGLGRTTDSLMLMVTPRIIIQEEEEDKLLGTTRP